MMTVYNVQLGSVSASTLTSPATTLLVKEALTKGVFQPSLPSTTVHTTDGTVGHKARGPLNLGAGEGLELKEALEKGAKIKAISIWTYAAKESSGETVGPTFGALSSPWSTSRDRKSVA